MIAIPPFKAMLVYIVMVIKKHCKSLTTKMIDDMIYIRVERRKK